VTALGAVPASAEIISLSDERASIRRRLLQRSAREVAEKACGAYPAAEVEARRRCADLPGVRFEQMFVAEQWPGGVFDRILLSEVVYSFSREDVGGIATSVTCRWPQTVP
jgi:hypothetical protein